MSNFEDSFVSLVLFLLPVIFHHQLVLGENDTQEEETENTRNVKVLVDGEVVSSTFINGVHAPRITIQLAFKDLSFFLDLTLNVHLISSSYVDKIVGENETVYRSFNRSKELCYYGGEIRYHLHSKAAFSTCDGLKGFFVFDNFTFHVRPLQTGSSDLSQLYEIKKVVNDPLSKWVCGVEDLKENFLGGSYSRTKRQIISDSMEGQKVVELYVATDARRLRYFNGNVNKLSASTKEIVNTANLLYQPVGFFVVLAGTEYWTSDQINVVPDSSETLNSWQNYRSSNVVSQHYNDVGFLISGQSFDASVLGLANIATMCSSKNSGGIMTAIQDNSAVSGAILAHEIGHVFGLSHDSIGCDCESPLVPCIMSARASTGNPSLYFSSCSKAQLRTSMERGFDVCLKDFPSDQSSHYQTCGNGILEQGEECDCGRRPSGACNSGCCDKNTCRLIGQAKCASGKCCDVNSCQLQPAGFRCRPTIGSCDITEVCDGTSSFCPKNIYKHDGIACSVNGVDAYCYGGMCRSQRSQCNELFDVSVPESNPLCYQTYNLQGTQYGFCTYQNNKYTGCQPQDAMCGALQCDTRNGNLTRYTNFLLQTTKSIGSYQCRGVLLDYGSRVENPGMVPNGAACGVGMMCVSQKCIAAETKLKENPCPSCNNGVCTNDGKCVCDPDTTCTMSKNTTPPRPTTTTTESTTTSIATTTTTESTTPPIPTTTTTATTPRLPPTSTPGLESSTTTSTTTTPQPTVTPRITTYTSPTTPVTTRFTITSTITPRMPPITPTQTTTTTSMTTSMKAKMSGDEDLAKKLGIGFVVSFSLLFIILMAIFLYKKGFFKNCISRCKPVKKASLEANRSAFSKRRTGLENSAYESEFKHTISTISREHMVVRTTRVPSFYPSSDDNLETHDGGIYRNTSEFQLVTEPNFQEDDVKILLEPPSSPPARPPVPPQHLKPKSNGFKSEPPPQSLNPRADVKASKPPGLAIRPAVLPALAKPKPASKVTSPKPPRPTNPPQVSPQISSPAFPFKPKPSRPAPSAPPLSAGARPADGGEAEVIDVKRLKAKFEVSMA